MRPCPIRLLAAHIKLVEVIEVIVRGIKRHLGEV
jgi:hypothetical protein